jgi:AGCS family alanine or glycine:cation symporter
MTFSELITKLDNFAWGPVMLILLVGTGVYLSIRMLFPQFIHFGYAMKNTIGKMFKKHETGEGEISPWQAVTTALAATVGTGNIAGVTGAIVAGGPGAVFWMWLSAIFGMATKYSEAVFAVNYRERNSKGEWVGGPMYYIKNGLGKNWAWLGSIFCVFGALAAFGIGNMTQVNTIATSINTMIDSFGGNTGAANFHLFNQTIPVSSLIIGVVMAVLCGLVLFGGIKRIGSVTEKMVPVMAVVYILASIVVLIYNVSYIGTALSWIFGNAFSVQAAFGGAVGIATKTIIQKGVARGVFSNEAGLGSAPMAHAATSEKNPVMQGLYGIFEVFMDTIVICSMTALVLLTSAARGGVSPQWGGEGGTPLISAAFGTVLGDKIGSMIIAVCITLFALSTLLAWSLYGTRCFEYLFGTRASRGYQIVFVMVVVIGATMKMGLVWDIADMLNGFMAIPNLIAVLALSPVVIKMTREHFKDKKHSV